jgi:protoporphyrinogen/coproporphyrinogen III oxidase
MVDIAVVGAGPAGLTAAHRLRQAGHRVEVLEARSVVGGRTHAEHFGPGHHCDTGAGWLASFYTRTLALLDELGYRDILLRARSVRGASDLLVAGQRYRWPYFAQPIAESPLLADDEKQRLAGYIEQLMAEQPDGLRPDLAYDDRDAEQELAPLGLGVVDYVMRPMFEGPFFSRLTNISAAMVRAWLRVLRGAAFYQVEGGMDAPWLRLAETLEVRPDQPVEALRIVAGGVELVGRAGARRYDGAVLAIPAPAAARLLAGQLDAAPPWLAAMRYAPQVRVYAARPVADDAAVGFHMVPPELAFSVEFYSGRHGAWGACPPDWQWGLVCAYGPASQALLDQPADRVTQELWQAGRAAAPELFALEQAAVVHLIRWEWAVPMIEAGHYTHLAGYVRRPPLVLAGDWTEQACVEGAVRSGEAAAAAFGSA